MVDGRQFAVAINALMAVNTGTGIGIIGKSNGVRTFVVTDFTTGMRIVGVHINGCQSAMDNCLLNIVNFFTFNIQINQQTSRVTAEFGGKQFVDQGFVTGTVFD